MVKSILNMHKTVSKFCVGCGTSFESRNRGAGRGWTRFCSNGCRAKTEGFKGGPSASRLRRRYGMELNEYEARLNAQGGRCALCRANVGYTLYVDHNHETKQNRSLLCARCNSAVGVFDWLTWDSVLVYWGYTHFHNEGIALAQAAQDMLRGEL